MSSPRMKRLRIIGSTMILVIVPFCLYYLFYVQSQNQYFTKRNFRVLAGIGDQMKSKIDNLGTSLINAVKNAQQEKKEIANVSDPKPDNKGDKKGGPQSGKGPEKKPQMKATKEAEKPVSDKLRSSIALIDHSGTSLKYDVSQQTMQQTQQADVQRRRVQIRPPVTNANTSSANANLRPAPPSTPPTTNMERSSSNSRPVPRARSRNNGRATRSVRMTSPQLQPQPGATTPEPTVALNVKTEQ